MANQALYGWTVPPRYGWVIPKQLNLLTSPLMDLGTLFYHPTFGNQWPCLIRALRMYVLAVWQGNQRIEDSPKVSSKPTASLERDEKIIVMTFYYLHHSYMHIRIACIMNVRSGLNMSVQRWQCFGFRQRLWWRWRQEKRWRGSFRAESGH